VFQILIHPPKNTWDHEQGKKTVKTCNKKTVRGEFNQYFSLQYPHGRNTTYTTLLYLLMIPMATFMANDFSTKLQTLENSSVEESNSKK